MPPSQVQSGLISELWGLHLDQMSTTSCGANGIFNNVPASPEFDSRQGTQDGYKLDIWYLFQNIC